MRPFRFLLTTFVFLISLTLIFNLVFASSEQQTPVDQEKKDKASAFFSWTAPVSLFPPSAIISLTDDNSTFFLARPAAFGPLLPSEGFSGQLWIGSGFSDDSTDRDELVIGSEGELGCSDVPGWDDDDGKFGSEQGTRSKSTKRLRKPLDDSEAPDTLLEQSNNDDGTDDYLHQPLPDSKLSKPSSNNAKQFSTAVKQPNSQTPRDRAGIAGKIALLSRGGCGFLEKVKWAQRRGAVALIVGDDIRGGPLVTMYAKGDTSNVTIPAIFTSHTTAHLLSSLMPPGGAMFEGVSEDRKDAFNSRKTRMDHADPKSNRQSSSDLDYGSKSHAGFLQRLSNWLGLSSSDDPSYIINDSSDNILEISSNDVLESSNTRTKPLSYNHAGGYSGNQRNSPHEEGRSDTSSKNKDPDQGWFQGLHWRAAEDNKHRKAGKGKPLPATPKSKNTGLLSTTDESPEREGLWVTLTPTNMSSSPFFDTLLVLVVSPLVTLTVVYALLLLRSRIRRRRWRAPKSIVERLPVRTYHTLSSEPSSTSQSLENSMSSPTTPLLQSTREETLGPSQPIRSRTTPEIPTIASSSAENGMSASPRNSHEKRESGLAQWRRKYGGRQRECVVCLEEYVDGVSRVMSLPCGHEFHVECITPWLVTRRRTCPICKGDVVRSLASGSYQPNNSSSPPSLSTSASSSPSQSRSSSPSRQALLPRSGSDDRDLERGAWSTGENRDIPSISRQESSSSPSRVQTHNRQHSGTPDFSRMLWGSLEALGWGGNGSTSGHRRRGRRRERLSPSDTVAERETQGSSTSVAARGRRRAPGTRNASTARSESAHLNDDRGRDR